MPDKFSFIRKTAACLTLAAMFSPVLTGAAQAQQMGKTTKANALTEDQKILHVLNRLGFGARPGDVERVKAVGLQNYIEQQLNPASINDAVADAKVANLGVLNMSNEELFAKYPNQGAVLAMVARQNGLTKGDVADLRKKNQVKDAPNGDAAAMPNDGAATPQPNNGNAATDGAMTMQPKTGANPAQMNDEERARLQAQVADIYRQYDLGRPQQITQQLVASRLMRAVYSERQLQEVMVDFWSNHFNVYTNKGAVRWFLPQYDRDVIRPNALGNFKDLLTATAESPAMLFYLDNFQSVSPKAQPNNQRPNALNQQRQLERVMQNPQLRAEVRQRRGVTDAQIDQRLRQMQQQTPQNPQAAANQQQRPKRGINENYARELMELHTLGVGGGYTQKDVQEVARCFTGWTIIDPTGYRKLAGNMLNDNADQKRARQARRFGLPADAPSGTFYFNPRQHDDGEKIVLGQKINEGGINDGLKVIDILVNSPATAHFVAQKLAVRFVSDNPSEALVGRVADAFHNSRGDIKTTLRALFTDPEFFAPENYRAKIKQPFELVVSAMRTIGADTNGGQVQAMLAKMGEPLYGWITPNGYPDLAEDWVNAGALLERINFSVALASNRIPGTRVNLSNFEAGSKEAILDKAAATILGGEISPSTKAMLLKQLQQPLPVVKLPDNPDEATMENASMQNPNAQQKIGGGKRAGYAQQARLLPPSGNPDVFKVVGLIIGSPDFQRQ